MTIIDVRLHRFEAALHTPFVTALRSTDVVQSTVVELVDSEGVCGWGEAPQVWRVTGESLEGATACIAGPLADVVRGRCVDDLVDLTREVSSAVVANFGAKSAVDVALHDLAARRLGVSLPRFLGTSRHAVGTDVTLSAGAAADLPGTARTRVSDGFGVLKLKVGTDAEGDIDAVTAVRAAVGPEVRLRLDANQGWTVREAIRVISELEARGADVELVEQPVAADDLEGLARVTSCVDTLVMADESVFGLRDLDAVIRHRAADLVNIKLAKCGGIAAAMTMVQVAQAHGVEWIVGSMMEGPVGVGAAASLAAALHPTRTCDLDAAWWLAGPATIGGLTYVDDVVHLPDRPGLGIEGLL